jgi:hypothetical protein
MEPAVILHILKSHPILAGLGVACVLGLLFVWLLYRYGMSTWSTAQEVALALPGDDLIDRLDQVLVDNQAITIHAPAAAIWPHIAQTGQDRAGFYSFDWLERLFTFDIHNVYTPHPEWLLRPGDYHRYHQAGIGCEIQEVVPFHYFTSLSDSRHPSGKPGRWPLHWPGTDFAWTWNFVLIEQPDHTTRLLTRAHCFYSNRNPVKDVLILLLFGLPSIVMVTKMLKTFKAVAEGRHPKARAAVAQPASGSIIR